MLNSLLRRRGESRAAPNLPPLVRPFLPRSASEETLSTLVTSSAEANPEGDDAEPHDTDDLTDLSSLLTISSDETAFDDLKVFGKSLTRYTQRRDFPIVLNFLSPGSMVFKSVKSLAAYQDELRNNVGHEGHLTYPILHISVPVLGIFKKNSPFMVIHKYGERGAKYEYCKVYFKILEQNLSCYILVFASHSHDPIVMLNNNSCRPSVDLNLENTKVRITGVSGATSTFGTGLIKTFLLSDTSPHLCDRLGVTFDRDNVIKTIKIATAKDNELARLLVGNKSNSTRFRNLMLPQYLINMPFAKYIDLGDKRIGSMLVRHGSISCFDEKDASTGSDEISNTALILVCINLVLREQELRKNKGNNKPTLVSSPLMANPQMNLETRVL
jgi:hypothetical protein